MIRKCRGENTHEETAQKQNSADAMWEKPRTRSGGEAQRPGGEEGKGGATRRGLAHNWAHHAQRVMWKKTLNTGL